MHNQVRSLSIFLGAFVAAPQNPPASNPEIGSRSCAGCHAEIYRKYSATGMARTSGVIGTGSFRESFERAEFSDPASGAQYRLESGPNGYRLAFARRAAGVEGQRMLEWYIGSGGLGRSYLFSMEGFLFQSPVSYYSTAAKWDLSPGYGRKRTIDLTRAVETACLQCHASRLQPIAGTQNRFAAPPFLEGGVSCERCHGPGTNHVAKMSRGAATGPREIVNPSKLDPRRRDSVCAQCHLTGVARVARSRPAARSYRPGDALSDSLAVFVWSDAGSAELTATSHYERLHQSACKKRSGDRMWCGSCHDPHDRPAPANRAEHYRNRCQACHQESACTEIPATRRTAGDDCAGCH
ncbi:MAG: multiheme c-type cytochrome, partial [Bryobacteraceae bacterium]